MMLQLCRFAAESQIWGPDHLLLHAANLSAVILCSHSHTSNAREHDGCFQ